MGLQRIPLSVDIVQVVQCRPGAILAPEELDSLIFQAPLNVAGALIPSEPLQV